RRREGPPRPDRRGRYKKLRRGDYVGGASAVGVGFLVVFLGLGGSFGFYAFAVVLDFAVALFLGPAEDGGEEVGGLLGDAYAAVPGFDGDAGAAGEDVVEVAGALVGGCVDDFGAEVVVGAGEGFGEVGFVGDEFQQVVDEGAVAAQEVFDAGDVEAGAGCEAVAGVPHGLEAVAADEGDAVGAGFGDLAVEAVGDGVDGVLRHDAVGGVLAARDEDEPGDGVGDDVFAGQLRGLFGLAGEQGAEARVDALHVVGGEGRGEDSVDLVQDVFDVGLRGGGVGLVEVPGGVGGADDPVPAPGDHEEHGLVGAEEDRKST